MRAHIISIYIRSYKILYSTTVGQRYIKRGNESTQNPGKQFKMRNLYMSQALNIKK